MVMKSKINIFYNCLHTLIDKIPKYDICLVIGDFSANAGADTNGVEKTSGKHSLGSQNQNGERPIELPSIRAHNWWNTIPTQRHLESNLEFPSWNHQETN